MRLCYLAAVLCALCAVSPVEAAPKVGVLYSSWSNASFKNEFDQHLKTLGWPSEKLHNREVAQWIGRLDEFDLIVATSVANYEQPQDMAPYKEAWLRFLERGGGILIVDASYDSVLDLWMSRLGPDFMLRTAGCAPYTKKHGGSRAIECDPTDPLLHVPHELPPLFKTRSIWAHIDAWGDGWRSLVTCADKKSLFVTRDVGKGCVAVTSYFALRGDANRAVATGLLENLWTRVLGLRAGIAVTAFDAGEALPGPRRASLEVRNTGKEAATYRAVLRIGYDKETPTQVAQEAATTAPGASARFSLPYAVTRRGSQRLAIDIVSGEKTLLTMQRTAAVPPMVAMTIPDRHLYPPATALPFSAAIVQDAGVALTECAAELLLNGQVARRWAPAEAGGNYTVDVSALALGEHKATLRLVRGNTVLGTTEEVFYRHRPAKVRSREDGTLLVDEKPFFPFGWYHVSWPFTAEQRLAFVRDIAAGGFNTVHAGIKQLDEWEPFLSEAEKLGVRVITEFGVDPIQVITRYRDHPAVLAWNPGDEPDGSGISPAEMLARYDRFKRTDPDHPTYMVLCVPSTYARYAGCAEIIAPDPYPIPRSPIALVTQSLTSARQEAAKHGRPIWGVLQCFGYEKGPWRVPTFAECRNMTYQALLAGVKGIIYYTYADNGFDISKHPKLWAEMKTLPPEIERLRPFLLNGTLRTLEVEQPDVVAGIWQLGERRILCVVSTSQKEPQEVALRLPAGAETTLKAFLPGQELALTLQAGKLTGKLAPLEVQVLELAGK
jgi:hypothetical protein